MYARPYPDPIPDDYSGTALCGKNQQPPPCPGGLPPGATEDILLIALLLLLMGDGENTDKFLVLIIGALLILGTQR